MKTKQLIISLLLVASAFQIQAQERNGFNREIGFTTGVMVPTDKDFGGDITFGLTYEKFYINGLGMIYIGAVFFTITLLKHPLFPSLYDTSASSFGTPNLDIIRSYCSLAVEPGKRAT